MTTAAIYFHQLTTTRFVAKAALPNEPWEPVNPYETVAEITQLSDEDERGRATFRVVYHCVPSERRRLPAKTTRTVCATYDTVQKRILDRGWY